MVSRKRPLTHPTDAPTAKRLRDVRALRRAAQRDPSQLDRITEYNAIESPLLRLPTELRDMIYACVFENEQWVFHEDDSSDEKGFLSSRSFRESNLGLLSTSRQLRAETKLLPYQLATFHFRFYDWDDWSEVEWLMRLQMRFFETRTVEQLQAMTTVTVSGHVDVLNTYIHYRGNVASWFDFLPPMSGKKPTQKWKSLQKQLGAKCTGLDF
ncbi:unnamed protein product [Alternaria sp. RS040]